MVAGGNLMNVRTGILIIALFSVSTAASAQQRPLVTEDPETVGAERVLVEGGVELGKGQFYPASGLKGDTTHVATFGVSVGLGSTAEVQVDGGLLQRLHVTERHTAPNSASLAFTGDSTSSFEDMTVATKIRLAPETQSRPAIGIRFGTKLPTAPANKGLGLGTTDFFASALLGKTVASVRTVANVSWLVLGSPAFGENNVNTVGFGVSVARAITNEFEAVGEINGRMKPSRDLVAPGLESRGALRLAGRYTYQLLRLDFGVLIGITARDPGFGVSAGATYVIGR